MHMKHHTELEELIKLHGSPWADISLLIETGTFRGESALRLSKAVDHWITIDINQGYTKLAQDRLKQNGVKNVTCVTGDSRDVLPSLLKFLQCPLCIFLDAHFSRVKSKILENEPDMVHGPIGADFPLEAELVACEQYKYPMIVVVDDVVLFGGDEKTSLRGLRQPGDNTEQWEAWDSNRVESSLKGRVKHVNPVYKGCGIRTPPDDRLPTSLAYYCN